jgi:antitoxin HicB
MKRKENNPMEDQLKYPFEIRHLSEEEGGGYLISFPDLPGCISDGETIEAAIKNGIDAVNSWIATSREFHDSIPKAGSSQASGRFVQRLPKNLHSRLAERAKQEGVSMNALVTAIIAESIGKRETQKSATKHQKEEVQVYSQRVPKSLSAAESKSRYRTKK